MFNLFGRGKNTVQNPAILVASIGEATIPPHEKEIYRAYSNITELAATNFPIFESFMTGKRFDMVHLCVNMAEDGTIDGEPGLSVLRILTAADTKLAVFTSENPVASYQATFPPGRLKGLDNMHLVLTLDRMGENFFHFFQQIFDLMAQGKSMPVAWVTLAPQHPGPWMEKMPETIFLANRGQMKFLP